MRPPLMRRCQSLNSSKHLTTPSLRSSSRSG
nr:MAG TPA: hypothetical protein [Crassvirales sp.]